MNQITTFFTKISQETHKIYEQNSHDYSNLAQSQSLVYVHDRPMVPDHSVEYEENPASHQGGMLEDGLTNVLMDRLTDWWTGPLSYNPEFNLGISGNNNIYEYA